MTRSRLLYVTDAEGLGGAEGYLRTLLLRADQQRYDVGLVLPPRKATQPLVDEARQHGIAVHLLDLAHHDGFHLPALWQAWRAFRRLRPKIIHFVLPSPRRCAEMIVAAALAGVPRRIATFQLVTPVPPFARLSATIRRLNRQAQYRTLHRGIAVSQGNAHILREQYGFPAARLSVIPNAIDPSYWTAGIGDGHLRTIWGVPANAPLIGVVGRLSRQKGHTILFDALPQIWAVHPQAHVVLLGQGELEAALRAAATLLDDQGRIHFVGQQTAMPQALSELDVFALPSLYEGLSFAVLEAMATQRAIVATNVDGTCEALDHDRTGLLVPPDDAGAFAQALIRLLDDAGLRQQLGRAARQVVTQRFNQQHMLEQTFQLYEER